MNFVSAEFLSFLAICYGLYWLTRGHGARLWLLTIASYVFYAAWDWRFCGLMLLVTSNAYLVGRYLPALAPRERKLLLSFGIGANLGVLGLFKYCNFFLANAGALAATLNIDVAVPTLNILLPVGISFYTFHAISYVVDVYRGLVPAERSFLKVALYIAFFPQLIAGPILRASLFMPQLGRLPRFRPEQQITGIMLFVRGFIYKAAIADPIAQICDPIYATVGQQNGKALVVAAIAFSAQIYFDFAGYTSMAIGTARFFGYRTPKNFDYPYSSLSLSEFWRRWHISLSSWLRDYLYIPLGGNRRGALATYRNLMLTMLLGGLWHGASWNFVIWGGLHGVGLCMHRLWWETRTSLGVPAKPTRWGPAVALVLTQGWVFVAWIFFRAETLPDALRVLEAVLSLRSYVDLTLADPVVWIVLALAADHVLGRWPPRITIARPARQPVYWLAMGAIVAVTLMLVPLVQRPFIYFQF